MTPRFFTVMLFLLMLAIFGVGCTSVELAPTFSIQDSAGVRIVENSEASWLGNEAWRLSASPQLELGVSDGDPDFEFHQVVGAVRLDNGTLVVANAGSNQLRLYDSSGRHLGNEGGRGSGPGEFEGLQLLVSYRGDSIAAFDSRLRRITILDGSGMFARTVLLTASEDRIVAGVVGVFADGTFLVTTVRHVPNVQPGVLRPAFSLFHYSALGAQGDSLGFFHGREAFGARLDNGQTVRSDLYFGRTTHAWAHGTRFYLSSTDDYAISQYGTTGSLEAVFRKHHRPPAVSEADVTVLRDSALLRFEDRPALRAALERALSEMPVHETTPAFHSALADDAGNTWVRQYQMPSVRDQLFDVFDPTGRLLGPVPLPDGFTPYHIGQHFALGTWVDELGVEYVRLYGLEKPQ